MNEEKACVVIGDLLEFARKYAEQNDDSDDVNEAWDAVDAARLFLAQTKPSTPRPEVHTENEKSLAALKANGLTFAQCVTAFAESDDNPYVVAGRVMMSEGDLEMDDNVVISGNDDGAYVMAWKFVSNDFALGDLGESD